MTDLCANCAGRPVKVKATRLCYRCYQYRHDKGVDRPPVDADLRQTPEVRAKISATRRARREDWEARAIAAAKSKARRLRETRL